MKTGAIMKILELYRSRCADSERASNYDKAKGQLLSMTLLSNKMREVVAMAVSSQEWGANDPDDDRWTRFYRKATTALDETEAEHQCEWTQEDWDCDTYGAACGAEWSFIDGGPKYNQMNFCPVCGFPLVEVKYDDVFEEA